MQVITCSDLEVSKIAMQPGYQSLAAPAGAPGHVPPPLPWSGHVPPPPLLELAHVQCTPVWQFLFTYGRLLWTPHIFLFHPQNHSRLSIGLTSIYYICVEIYVISALYFVNVPLLAQRPGDATVINNIKGGPKREAVDFKTPRSIFMIFAHLQSDTALG